MWPPEDASVVSSRSLITGLKTACMGPARTASRADRPTRASTAALAFEAAVTVTTEGHTPPGRLQLVAAQLEDKAHAGNCPEAAACAPWKNSQLALDCRLREPCPPGAGIFPCTFLGTAQGAALFTAHVVTQAFDGLLTFRKQLTARPCSSTRTPLPGSVLNLPVQSRVAPRQVWQHCCCCY